MTEDDRDDVFWPNIGGNGSLHDLAERSDPTPRLLGMKSVSKSAAWALAPSPKTTQRVAGFAPRGGRR